jgi:uncharacterized membrane protein
LSAIFFGEIIMLEKIKRYSRNIIAALGAIYASIAMLDAIYITGIASGLYHQHFHHVMREEAIVWPWLLFYSSYGMITFVLAVVPNREKTAAYAAIDGALLGFASYGAYNLTNYSLLAHYPLQVALLDLTWGTLLTALAGFCGKIAWDRVR